MKTCPLFVNAKMVIAIAHVGPATARRRLSKVRKTYRIHPYGEVTLRQYCTYYSLDINDVIDQLLGNYHGNKSDQM